jgi:transcriptional regulator with XRE-family HTH domain
MQEKIKEIAVRIKEMRELNGISLSEMAASLALSEEVYQGYEAGKEDISASRLYEIAQKLGVDLALLLTGSTPRMNTFCVTRNGKGVNVERRKQYQYQALAANFANKKSEPFLVTVPPRGDDAEVTLNQHPGQEMDYMLEGRLKIVVCGNEIILQAGDCIYYDSSYPHGMVALDDQPAKFIALVI